MGKMDAEEKGAAETAPTLFWCSNDGRKGWEGKKGAKCSTTPMGPMPGPPPP
jgi:hypothetical protein